jgi:hypothetical protein
VDGRGPIGGRAAARVAYFAAVLNLAAGLAMLFVLRPGLPVPGSTPSGRLGFIKRNPALWWSGWILWHAAAVSLVLLLVILAWRFGRRAPIRAAIAVIVAVAGLAADLSTEAFLMGAPQSLDERAFVFAEAGALVVNGYLANGLYTLAGILLTWAGARELPRPVLLLSVVVWGAGLVLAGASLSRSSAGQVWSGAILMSSFVLWAALVGRWLQATDAAS